jgi:hypothetical protein
MSTTRGEPLAQLARATPTQARAKGNAAMGRTPNDGTCDSPYAPALTDTGMTRQTAQPMQQLAAAGIGLPNAARNSQAGASAGVDNDPVCSNYKPVTRKDRLLSAQQFRQLGESLMHSSDI